MFEIEILIKNKILNGWLKSNIQHRLILPNNKKGSVWVKQINDNRSRFMETYTNTGYRHQTHNERRITHILVRLRESERREVRERERERRRQIFKTWLKSKGTRRTDACNKRKLFGYSIWSLNINAFHFNILHYVYLYLYMNFSVCGAFLCMYTAAHMMMMMRMHKPHQYIIT